MRFFHLADLHIGKTVSGFSMLPAQRHVLSQVERLARTHRPDAIVIAGDIYDRPAPPAEAVALFDDTLTALADAVDAVLIIGGNHDSPERLDFAARLLFARGVHLCGRFQGAPRRVTLRDAHGPVHFHLLPFVKPAHVRPFFPEAALEGYDQAVRAALSGAEVVPGERNVLVAHQFFSARGFSPERSDSEADPIGGLEAVDTACLAPFDYVALGHLHGPQQVGAPTIRYAGSPLKYSFSECFHQKGVTLVNLDGAGGIRTERLALTPLHDMRRIRGPLSALMDPGTAQAGDPADYLHVTLTDKTEPLDAMARLRTVYPHIMALQFGTARDAALSLDTPAEKAAPPTPLAWMNALYEAQHGAPLPGDEAAVLSTLLSEMEAMP